VDQFRVVLELMPIMLALIAIPLMAKSMALGRSKIIGGAQMLSAVLLIICETGWILYTSQSIEQYSLVLYLWPVFNSLVMGIFIATSLRSGRSKSK
jgi:uncharacterized membrane protein